jgi:hypothetical protein
MDGMGRAGPRTSIPHDDRRVTGESANLMLKLLGLVSRVGGRVPSLRVLHVVVNHNTVLVARVVPGGVRSCSFRTPTYFLQSDTSH